MFIKAAITIFFLTLLVQAQSEIDVYIKKVTKLAHFPDGFVEEVVKNEHFELLIPRKTWKKIIESSEKNKKRYMSGLSEKSYMTFKKQRSLIRDLRKSSLINEIDKYILLDKLVLYYFYSMNKNYRTPEDLEAEHKKFFSEAEVDYQWIEMGAVYSYSHSFLHKLIKIEEKNKWIDYYKELFKITKFDPYLYAD